MGDKVHKTQKNYDPMPAPVTLGGGEIEAENHSPLAGVFTPLKNYVAVQVFRVDKTKAGLILPGTSSETYETPTGTVLGVGRDVKEVAVGDVIVVGASVQCAKLTVGGRKFVLMIEEDVAGIKTRAADTEPKAQPTGPESDE